MRLNRPIVAHALIASAVIAAFALAQPAGQESNPPAAAQPKTDRPADAEQPHRLPADHPLASLQPQDEAAAMQAWMQSMSPGAPHEWLKQFEGDWKTTVKIYMQGPDAEPMVSQGKSTARMVLGGRFLEDQQEAQIMGMPMNGKGLMGFDNIRKQFVGTWADSMSTGITKMTGSLDPTGKILTMIGQMDEPMTGEIDKNVMYITTIDSPDRHTFQIREIQYGAPFTALEIISERVKE